jgi:outer membrane protein OmpA-like peptidoglycan-associated protein
MRNSLKTVGDLTGRGRRPALFLIPVVALAVLFTADCATKKFVTQQVTDLDKKVESVSSEVEESQKRLGEHDQKLATIGDLVGKQDSEIKAADAKIEEVRGLVRGQLISKETVRTGDTKFGFDSAELSPEAKAILDTFVQKLIAENKGVYLEIQGHTDSVGPEAHNLALGQKRAEAVRDYLYRQYHLPLHRMAVISLGSSLPAVDNKTREGRAQNRRIEILVYGQA